MYELAVKHMRATGIKGWENFFQVNWTEPRGIWYLILPASEDESPTEDLLISMLKVVDSQLGKGRGKGKLHRAAGRAICWRPVSTRSYTFVPYGDVAELHITFDNRVGCYSARVARHREYPIDWRLMLPFRVRIKELAPAVEIVDCALSKLGIDPDEGDIVLSDQYEDALWRSIKYVAKRSIPVA